MLFTASCWSNALIWVVLALMDALVCAGMFVMCELIVPPMDSVLSSLETSSSAKRHAYLFVYPPCAAAILAHVWRQHWYAVWMKGWRCNQVLLVSALLSQSSMSHLYILQCVRRLMTFINSCSSVYGAFAMIAISWQSAHLLKNSSGGSCGL